jgi:ferrous iron transport protein B
MKMAQTIAIAGNPNCGKTTLFNEFTGACQRVGNYPGVTVEKKEGFYEHEGRRFQLVDLPGTYSLTAYSLEEIVARDFLIENRPQMVVNIVDASNLERNLYLSVQFLELGTPLCIALNMVDVANNYGIGIDVDRLGRRLGVPVVPTVARKGKGKTDLMRVVAGAAEPAGQEPLILSYGPVIDRSLDTMVQKIESEPFLTGQYPARWVALKYLEKDGQIRSLGRSANPALSEALDRIVMDTAMSLADTGETYPEAVIADYRYRYIRALLDGVVTRGVSLTDGDSVSDKIDRIVTHRWAGPVLMIGVIFALYHLTFSLGEIPAGWCEAAFGAVSGWVDQVLSDGLLKSLVISGLIDGVGGVLGFVPLILLMFLGIGFLEDSGYLARVAFMLDRIFRVFGLHGASVIPFIVSGGIAGGCAVPGVMATRTLRSPRERLATLLTVPFMNCGAKLPVFALLVAAFFSANKALIMLLITLLSWTGALLVAKVLRSTVIRGDEAPFVMELPPYRWPTVKGLLLHTGERVWQYVRKAGTVILAIAVLVWAAMSFPGLSPEQRNTFEGQRRQVAAEAARLPAGQAASWTESALSTIDARQAEAALRASFAGRMGTGLEVVSRWAGFDWRTNIALVGGFAAKEVIVSTLGTAYSLGEIDAEKTGSLAMTLSSTTGWRPLVALSLIVFVIFYAPCVVSTVCISKEAGSWRWGLFSVIFNTVVAFSAAVAVFQIGTLLGF